MKMDRNDLEREKWRQAYYDRPGVEYGMEPLPWETALRALSVIPA